MTTIFHGWREVPAHLLAATALRELEYPRVAAGPPAAWVEATNWRGRSGRIPLYDARTCPPSAATAAQLEAAERRSTRRRICADCRAHCQRPLPAGGDDPRRLCPACRRIARLHAEQAALAHARRSHTQRAKQLLSWDDAAVLQVDLTVPPPTPAGRRRPATAARVWAVGVDGGWLVDVAVRLVGPRARHVPPGVVTPEAAAPRIHEALTGRRLIVWQADELRRLHHTAPHPTWWWYGPTGQLDTQRVATVHDLASGWRGQLDPHTRDLTPCLPPGAPDRLLLMLRRIAALPTEVQPKRMVPA